jgi:plasmid maintenance system antidote protein VapI
MDTLKPHIRLKIYFIQNLVKQGDFAALLGTPQSTLSEIVTGKRPPQANIAVEIERLTDGAVEAACWGPR